MTLFIKDCRKVNNSVIKLYLKHVELQNVALKKIILKLATFFCCEFILLSLLLFSCFMEQFKFQELILVFFYEIIF